MTVLKSVQNLSSTGVALEKHLRETRFNIQRYLDAIEGAGSDPEINKLGLYNINTAPFRQNTAEALKMVENAHALICENHLKFNAIAEDNNLDVPQTRDGGGR